MGKTYFLTGGNRGIGFELVKKLSEDPSNTVIATARDLSRSTDLVELSKTSPNIKIVILDVSDEKSISELDAQLKEVAKDGIDVSIQNAVKFDKDSLQPVLNVKRQVWIDYYITNVVGPIEVTKIVKPYLDKKETKQLLFFSTSVSSISQYIPVSNGVYGQTKAALNYTTKSLDFELGKEGYTSIAFHPGAVKTDSGNFGFKTLLGNHPELKDFDIPFLEPKESVDYLVKLFAGFTKEDSGKFFNYDGTELTW